MYKFTSLELWLWLSDCDLWTILCAIGGYKNFDCFLLLHVFLLTYFVIDYITVKTSQCLGIPYYFVKLTDALIFYFLIKSSLFCEFHNVYTTGLLITCVNLTNVVDF